MAEARHVSPPEGGLLPAAFAGWMPIMEALLQFQRMQWELVGSWQSAMAAAQQELFDEWVCRWGGGVPIDA